jgi:hypothetical protein
VSRGTSAARGSRVGEPGDGVLRSPPRWSARRLPLTAARSVEGSPSSQVARFHMIAPSLLGPLRRCRGRRSVFLAGARLNVHVTVRGPCTAYPMPCQRHDVSIQRVSGMSRGCGSQRVAGEGVRLRVLACQDMPLSVRRCRRKPFRGGRADLTEDRSAGVAGVTPGDGNWCLTSRCDGQNDHCRQ